MYNKKLSLLKNTLGQVTAAEPRGEVFHVYIDPPPSATVKYLSSVTGQVYESAPTPPDTILCYACSDPIHTVPGSGIDYSLGPELEAMRRGGSFSSHSFELDFDAQPLDCDFSLTLDQISDIFFSLPPLF